MCVCVFTFHNVIFPHLFVTLVKYIVHTNIHACTTVFVTEKEIDRQTEREQGSQTGKQTETDRRGALRILHD